MSRKVLFPPAEPVTVLLDPADDAAVTRTALAAHHPPAGRITVHPAPATRHPALGFDILAALGKPAELPGDWRTQAPPVWNTAAAWILALPITQLTVLRAHLLDAECWSSLLTLRERTGVHLVAVCHTRRPPAAMRTALQRAEHHTVSTEAPAGDLLAKVPTATPPRRDTQRRWITVPALAYLDFPHNFPPCNCIPPPASRPYVPERAYALDLVAHRLATRTASPQPAAALATALFTGAPISQLRTIHYSHLDQNATTLTLHDRYGTRRHGFATGCGTYPIPPWARPFLLAAVNLLHLSPRGDGLLLKAPHAVPHLTDFAEHCRLRPPQPAPPRTRQRRKTSDPPKVHWYDGYLRPSFEAVDYQQWLRSCR